MYSPFYKAAHMYSNLYTVKYSNQCCLYIECFMHSLTIAPKSNNNLSTRPSGGCILFCGCIVLSHLYTPIPSISRLSSPQTGSSKPARAAREPTTGHRGRPDGGREIRGCLSRVSVLSRPKLAFCVHIKV
jgi:hypothetical protein